jgi:hypothetical protein
MEMSQINYLAVIVAALSSFLVGGLWYSPIMFSNVWVKEVGLPEDELKNAKMSKIFAGSFFLSLIIAFNLAAFIGPEADFAFGLFAGAAAGIGWVCMSLGVIYLFEQRSMKLFLINAGYQAVTYTIMGGILGLWH